MGLSRILFVIVGLVLLAYIVEEKILPEEVQKKLPIPQFHWSDATDAPPQNDKVTGQGESVDAQDPTAAEFKEFSNQVFDSLPKKENLKSEGSSAVHQMPKTMTETAAKLGQLRAMIEAKPQLKKEAVSWYQNCALKSNLATSVRALCLNNAKQLHLEIFNTPWDYDKALIGKDVMLLAEKVEKAHESN
jgi:hypothetical protein